MMFDRSPCSFLCDWEESCLDPDETERECGVPLESVNDLCKFCLPCCFFAENNHNERAAAPPVMQMQCEPVAESLSALPSIANKSAR